MALMPTGRNREAANRAHNAGVAELRLGGDDRVGNVVVDGGMSFKLNLQLSTILEHPLYDLRLRARLLDTLALGQSAPEVREGFELDEVPDGSERGRDDGGFEDGGRGWDA